MTEKLLSIADAAKILGGLHIQTVYEMSRNGVLPTVRIGRRVFFEESDLAAWIEGKRDKKRTA